MTEYAWSAAGPDPLGGSVLVEQPERTEDRQKARKRRVAVVTGGATGLGRAMALEFARSNVNVAFNYIEMPDRDIGEQAVLTETALRAQGVRVFSAPCDVRDREEVESFFSAVAHSLGGVHYLINNAGIARDGALWRLSESSWRDVIDTNLTGAYNCMRTAAPLMRQQGFGKVVSIASHQAFSPGFGVANYAASKAAIVGLTRAAAVELGPSNVNVNAIAPGFVRTELLDGLPPEVLDRAEKGAVLGRVAEPEDIARVATFLCSEAARHITGQVIVVDGGLTLGS